MKIIYGKGYGALRRPAKGGEGNRSLARINS